jgi:hypothetical protein
MTDRCDDLHAYVDGELDDAEAAAFETHLVTCETCRAELPRLLALLAALDGAAEAAKASRAPHLAVVAGAPVGGAPGGDGRDAVTAGHDRDQREPDRPAPEPRAGATDLPRARRRRWQLAGGVSVVLAAAVVLLVLVPRPAGPAQPAIAELMGPTRPFEARIGYPGADGYRPLDVPRGTGSANPVADRLFRAELAFEQARNWHGVAVASLLAGDRERARLALARAPMTPEVDVDRAALAIIDGTPAALDRGLVDVDRALAAAPNNMAAHWNRALVLAAMKLPFAAAQELDLVAAAGESGWSTDARGRAEALRKQVVQRKTHWKEAYDAGRKLIDDGTPIRSDLMDVTGVMTIMLYDAVRAAPSRERVLALLPLAQALDADHHHARLTDYVQRIAASDFTARKPLADAYREMALGRMPRSAVDAFLAQLAAAHADDILLGAMVFAGRVGAQLDDYRRLATASADPWFLLNAEQETAAAEIARHDTAAAEHRLEDAIALAKRENLTYRSVRLHIDFVKLHKSMLKLSQAVDEAAAAYLGAITTGEWLSEMSALSDFASIHHNRYAYSAARAYLTELAERAEAGLTGGVNPAMDCLNRMYAYGSLANISVLQHDPERARAELAHIPACDKQAKPDVQTVQALRNALVRSELYRVGHHADDARLARDSLASLRGMALTGEPGVEALLAYIDGSLVIKDDPAAGRRALREAIAKADHGSNEFSIKARAYAFSLLAVEAGAASAFDDVIAVLAETLQVNQPGRCAVAIAVDTDRSVVAYRDARGAVGGQYVGARRTDPLDVTALVPADAVARLRACERIAVLTRAPVLGAGRLLPPELAWSYVLTEPVPPRPASDAGTRRLVVANPDTPPNLNLPALGPYPDAAPADGAIVLRGANATPSRVRAAMRDASVVELHTHGFLADDLFEASYLVLSPETDRQYALTASDVAQVHFTASPLVILGACQAATSSRLLEGGIGLAEAFLRAGARAVIASQDAVPDRGADAFFAAVRDRVLRGVDPAIALRDERMRRLATSHDDTWLSGVVVFQ